MIAIAIAMVLAVLIAVGVMFAAVVSHQLARSPALRARVRMRWHQVLVRLDEMWVNIACGAKNLSRSARR
jgi:hypothetical protein